jgi:hypothetical protein
MYKEKDREIRKKGPEGLNKKQLLHGNSDSTLVLQRIHLDLAQTSGAHQ